MQIQGKNQVTACFWLNSGRCHSPDTSTWRSATLAEFIAWNAGDFAPNVSAADVHGNNARVLVGRRDYLKPDGSAAYKRYMVGFESGGEQRARFYECEGDMSSLPSNRTLFINGVSTCKTILVSNYSIATQADAKVLRFAQEPTQLNVSNFTNEDYYTGVRNNVGAATISGTDVVGGGAVSGGWAIPGDARSAVFSLFYNF